MSISINGATPDPIVLVSDAKGKLAKMKTVAGWMTKRMLKGESLEDFQLRLQKIVDDQQVRLARVVLVRANGRFAIAPRVVQRVPVHAICELDWQRAWLSDGNISCARVVVSLMCVDAATRHNHSCTYMHVVGSCVRADDRRATRSGGTEQRTLAARSIWQLCEPAGLLACVCASRSALFSSVLAFCTRPRVENAAALLRMSERAPRRSIFAFAGERGSAHF